MENNPDKAEGVPPVEPVTPSRTPAPGLPPAKRGSAGKVMVMLSSVAKAPPKMAGESQPIALPIKPVARAIRNPIPPPKQIPGSRPNRITMSITPKKIGAPEVTPVPVPAPPPVLPPVIEPPPEISTSKGGPPPLPAKADERWRTSQTPSSPPAVISSDSSPSSPDQRHDPQSWKNLKANEPTPIALQGMERSLVQPPPLLKAAPQIAEVEKIPPTGPTPPPLVQKIAAPVAVEPEVKITGAAPPPLPAPKSNVAPIEPVLPSLLSTLPPPLTSAKAAPAKSEPISLPTKASEPLATPPALPTLTSELPSKTPPPLLAPSAPSASVSPIAPIDSPNIPAVSPPPLIPIEPKNVVPGPLAGAIASHVSGAVPPLLPEKEKEEGITPEHKLAPPQMPPETPRTEAPPLIQVKATPPAIGEPGKLAPPGGKIVERKVAEDPPATKPIPLSARPADATVPVAAPAKAPRQSASFFRRHIKPAKLPAPVKTSPSAKPASPASVPPPAASQVKTSPPAKVSPVVSAPVSAAATGMAPLTTPVSKPVGDSDPVTGAKPPPAVPVTKSDKPAPLTRAARIQRKRIIETGIFYTFFAVAVALLYFGGLYFGRETSVEGQVIPPPGTKLGNEAWIVGDFRELASGIADDLAAERAPKLAEIQERQEHVQRAQSDIATREERIRLLQQQVQEAKDEITATIKQARDDAQRVWDGPGAQLEDEYNSKLNALQKAIADRAKSLNLKYQPDDSYRSPEVWANAYRLALYETPPGVDNVKEHTWLETEMKAWRDFTKTVDDRQNQLREQAAQIQLSPTTKVTDANAKIDDLQHRIDGIQAEEDPIKAELQEAQTDLAEAQTSEAGLDAKYYKQLYALPESNVTKRLAIETNGRFTWEHLERDSAFAQGETTHHYWIFVRATRDDGRQFWALHHFDVLKNHPNVLMIEPDSFLSTKAILRPDLTPDEQQQ